MAEKKKKNLAPALMLALALGIVSWVAWRGYDAATGPEYAGSISCRACHEKEYELWRTSPHAMQFRAATNEIPSSLWAIGRTNIVQYLRAMPGGRLQTMPWAWDLRRKEWYSMPDSMVRDWIPGDAPLHWTHDAFTFNSNCMQCHVSPSWANFSPADGTFSTTWLEPTITCEGCHGPLRPHTKFPLLCPATRLDATSCKSCHSKTYRDGELVALEDIDFTADGRDLGEYYTWTRFLMSPCLRTANAASQTPTCLSCHTTSGRTKTDSITSCTQCHADKLADASHSRHKSQSSDPARPLPSCTDCHMPKTSFARIKHSDHSFRPPDPRLALDYGGASACAQCHKDRTEEENARIVEAWHPSSRLRERIRLEAELVARARRGDPDVWQDARQYLSSPHANPVIRTTLERLAR
ncbi:MAG: ammonia-forming cytochrome c nitrite reductase subunit c552 [Kiritimatiellae bacterium]|nr:ammonia-forming cytochrome c nitrite reductase subunit c552 [Kiritimatiellia bacterium]